MSRPQLLPPPTRHAAIAAALLAALSACGTDTPTELFDCCVDGIHYVCNTRLAYGQCLGRPADTLGCVPQATACPETANR